MSELKEQNQDITELSSVLMVLVSDPDLRRNRYVCDLVSRFYDKVWMHLIFEDKSLYTDLLQHSDPEVVAKVTAFHDSAREIKKLFGRHIKQWCHIDMSSEEAQDFSTQMQATIQQVMARVRAENEEIFPLVEAN
ncbi:MAG: hemerythrin domain-containing protein [bacterium]